ncbi:WXG100-like domain-containing protein [Saccharopolyspora phatthalungensis]|uniref:Outer membrane channel protein CpnT-like N-terminal domain-containing protein n=1 Tax=Saccharopolyspora phatthalungensis TaxID=664693 RepID=A0A840QBD8_9PSEU|nr:hypothetical protein [Saccharopolyspora phatthalungensis]MBB5159862.1 hypothetical protein [Saccharopolyspora phatthalungensis]
MSLMVPVEVRRLFQVLTGEDMTDADEDALFAVAERLESDAAVVEMLAPAVQDVVGRVRGGFSGKAADRFAERSAGFSPVLEAGGGGLRELAGFVRNLALQVQYLKFVTVGGLVLLLAEIAWAVAMAGPTGGASMAWLAARFAVMRFLLSRWWGQLFMRLAMGQVVGVGLQVLMDAGAQGLQFALGTRDKWDAQTSEMAAGVGAFSGLLALPLSALGNVVGNAVTKVLVRGLGDEVDKEVLEAAVRNVVEEHAEQFPVGSMAKFADVVSRNIEDYTGMSVRGTWAARFGGGLGESIEEGLTEMFGEAGYGAISGQGAQWNPFSFTAGLSEAIGSGIGNLMGLAVRGELTPAGRAREAADGEKDSGGADTDTDLDAGTTEELKTDSGSQTGEKLGFQEAVPEVDSGVSVPSWTRAGGPGPGSDSVPDSAPGSAPGSVASGIPVTSAIQPAGSGPEKAPLGGGTGGPRGGDGAADREETAGLSPSPGAPLADGPGSGHSVPGTAVTPPSGGVDTPGGEPRGVDAGGVVSGGVGSGVSVTPRGTTSWGEGDVADPDVLRGQARPGTPPPAYSPSQGDGSGSPGSGGAVWTGDSRVGTPPPAYGPVAGADRVGPESSGVDGPGGSVGHSEPGSGSIKQGGPLVAGGGVTSGDSRADSPSRGGQVGADSSGPRGPGGSVEHFPSAPGSDSFNSGGSLASDGVVTPGNVLADLPSGDGHTAPGSFAGEPTVQVPAPLVDGPSAGATDVPGVSSGAVGSGVASSAGDVVPGSGGGVGLAGQGSVWGDGAVPGAESGSGADSVAGNGNSGRAGDGVPELSLSSGSSDVASFGDAVLGAGPVGLPGDAVRVSVPVDVVSGGGFAEFVRVQVGDVDAGPVVLVPGEGSPAGGVVVSPAQASEAARGMGRDVVALMPARGRRGPRWMRFGADGSRPRPVGGPGSVQAPVQVGEGHGSLGALASSSSAVPKGVVESAVGGSTEKGRGAEAVADSTATDTSGDGEGVQGDAEDGADSAGVANWSESDLHGEVARARELGGSRAVASRIVQGTHDVVALARGDVGVSLDDVVALVAARVGEFGRGAAVRFSRELAARLGSRGSGLGVRAGAGEDPLADLPGLEEFANGGQGSHGGVSGGSPDIPMTWGFDPDAPEWTDQLGTWGFDPSPGELAHDLATWGFDPAVVERSVGSGWDVAGTVSTVAEGAAAVGGEQSYSAPGAGGEFSGQGGSRIPVSNEDTDAVISGTVSVSDAGGRKRGLPDDSVDEGAARRTAGPGRPTAERLENAEQLREEARVEARRGRDAGKPYSGEALGKKFGRTGGWGRRRLAEISDEGGVTHAALLEQERREQRREREAARAEAQRAHDAGERSNGSALGRKFGRSAWWGKARLREIRAEDGATGGTVRAQGQEALREEARAEAQRAAESANDPMAWAFDPVAVESVFDPVSAESVFDPLAIESVFDPLAVEGLLAGVAERSRLVAELGGLVDSLRRLLVGAPAGYMPGLGERVEHWSQTLAERGFDGVDVVALRKRVSDAARLVERLRSDGLVDVTADESALAFAELGPVGASVGEALTGDEFAGGEGVLEGDPLMAAEGWSWGPESMVGDMADSGLSGAGPEVVSAAGLAEPYWSGPDGLGDALAASDQVLRAFGERNGEGAVTVLLGQADWVLGPDFQGVDRFRVVMAHRLLSRPGDWDGARVLRDRLGRYLAGELEVEVEVRTRLGGFEGLDSSELVNKVACAEARRALEAGEPYTADTLAQRFRKSERWGSRRLEEISEGLSRVTSLEKEREEARAEARRARDAGEAHTGETLAQSFGRSAAWGWQRLAEIRDEGGVTRATLRDQEQEAVREAARVEARRARDAGEAHTGKTLAQKFRRREVWGRQRLAEIRDEGGVTRAALRGREQEAVREAARVEARRARDAGEPYNGETLAEKFGKSRQWGRERLAEISRDGAPIPDSRTVPLAGDEFVVGPAAMAGEAMVGDVAGVEMSGAGRVAERPVGFSEPGRTGRLVALRDAFEAADQVLRAFGERNGEGAVTVLLGQADWVLGPDFQGVDRFRVVMAHRLLSRPGDWGGARMLRDRLGRYLAGEVKVDLGGELGGVEGRDNAESVNEVARAEARRARDEGEPDNGEALARKFKMGAAWGWERLQEIRLEDASARPELGEQEQEDPAAGLESPVQGGVLRDSPADIRPAEDSGAGGETQGELLEGEALREAALAEVRRARDAGQPYTSRSLGKKFGKGAEWGRLRLREIQAEGGLTGAEMRERESEALREAALAEARRARDAGQPHTGETLGKMFGRSEAWGRMRLLNIRAEGGLTTADVEEQKREAGRREARRARDAGTPYRAAALGKKFGKSREWGRTRLREIENEVAGSSGEVVGFAGGTSANKRVVGGGEECG